MTIVSDPPRQHERAQVRPGVVDGGAEGEAEGGASGLWPAAARWGGRVAPAPVRRLGVSVGRRLDIINACETRPDRWWAGAAQAAVAAVSRTTKTAGASA